MSNKGFRAYLNKKGIRAMVANAKLDLEPMSSVDIRVIKALGYVCVERPEWLKEEHIERYWTPSDSN